MFCDLCENCMYRDEWGCYVHWHSEKYNRIGGSFWIGGHALFWMFYCRVWSFFLTTCSYYLKNSNNKKLNQTTPKNAITVACYGSRPHMGWDFKNKYSKQSITSSFNLYHQKNCAWQECCSPSISAPSLLPMKTSSSLPGWAAKWKRQMSRPWPSPWPWLRWWPLSSA